MDHIIPVMKIRFLYWTMETGAWRNLVSRAAHKIRVLGTSLEVARNVERTR